MECKIGNIRGARDHHQESITRVYTLFALHLAFSMIRRPRLPLIDRRMDSVLRSASRRPFARRADATFFVTQASIAEYLDLHRIFRTEPGRSVIAVRALAATRRAVESMRNVNGQEYVFRSTPISAFMPRQRHCARYRYQSVDCSSRRQSSRRHRNDRLHSSTASIGADYGAAFFADAGETSDSLSPLAASSTAGAAAQANHWRHSAVQATRLLGGGVGVGARYYTSIGPLRLDIALPTYRRPGDDRSRSTLASASILMRRGLRITSGSSARCCFLSWRSWARS